MSSSEKGLKEQHHDPSVLEAMNGSEKLYEPLSRERREIRILHIQPGDWNDLIQCSLRTVSLDDDPLYTTVSYCWGDVETTETIHVNGTPIAIMTNLFTALRQFRSIDPTPLLWADAICIHQSSNEEKSHQVSLMGEIYKRCAEVFVWLGSEGVYSKGTDVDPFHFARCLLETGHLDDLTCVPMTYSWWRGYMYKETPQAVASRIAFKDFVHHAWWTRLWTVQEIVLPRSARFFLGAWQMSLSDLVSTRTILNRCMYGLDVCCSVSYLSFPPDLQHLLHDFLNRMATIALSRGARRNKRLTYFPGDLHLICRCFCDRGCREPADKIFGLLGMIEDSKSLDFQPDYSSPVFDTFTRAMGLMLLSSNSPMNCLTGMGFGTMSHEEGLPSWVRDFAAVHPRSYAGLRGVDSERLKLMEFYSTSGDLETKLELSGDGKALHVQGVQVGTVETVFTRPDSDDLVPDGAEWEALCRWAFQLRELEARPSVFRNALEHIQLRSRSDFQKSIASLHSLPRAFWRTVNAGFDVEDRLSDWVADGANIIQLDAKFKRFADETLIGRLWALCSRRSWTSREFQEFINPVRVATPGRTMFRSESRKLGLCPLQAQVGDGIWILFGSKVPFLLRKKDKSMMAERPESNTQVFKFVGECFYDGVMFGEAVTGPDFIGEDIVLR
ncbi:HET-domain-containing protein [Lophiostoma macrostomum CBS 122681]|uniref:HET-domain-containing protein n=1 Tax=Lophiostoma macrostomum CBS 122681 TaxID=1314788 RepID=A0A6A6SPI6_9PLEO|nr:HET-domain-containing protein [Lophiostoma macrostomum CBS 122681]